MLCAPGPLIVRSPWLAPKLLQGGGGGRVRREGNSRIPLQKRVPRIRYPQLSQTPIGGPACPTGTCAQVQSLCAPISEVITFSSCARQMAEVEASSSTSADANKRKSSKKHMHVTLSLHASPIHSPRQTFPLYRSLPPLIFPEKDTGMTNPSLFLLPSRGQ